MKTLFIYFILLIALCLQSCKDSVSPPTPEENLIWNLDSISLSVSGTGIGFSKDTAINISSQQPFKIKIIFTAETNFDSSKGFQNVLITIVSKDFYYTFVKFGNILINQSHIIELDDALRFYNFVSFALNIENNLDSSYKYVKLKNIRVFEITYP